MFIFLTSSCAGKAAQSIAQVQTHLVVFVILNLRVITIIMVGRWNVEFELGLQSQWRGGIIFFIFPTFYF
jgi:hypothetical protein